MMLHYFQARPEGGRQLGQFATGPNLNRGPRLQMQEGPRAPAQERLLQHTDKFISFMFQM